MAKAHDPSTPAEMLSDSRPAAVDGAESTAERDPIAPAEQASDTSGTAADDDLLAAVTSISNNSLSGIDHTLDQLVTSTDLFDVPPLDIDGTA